MGAPSLHRSALASYTSTVRTVSLPSNPAMANASSPVSYTHLTLPTKA